MTNSNLPRKECISAYSSNHSSSQREVRTGIQTGRRPGGRSWCRGPPILIRMLCTLAYKPILCRHFLDSDFFFPDDPNLCQVVKNYPASNYVYLYLETTDLSQSLQFQQSTDLSFLFVLSPFSNSKKPHSHYSQCIHLSIYQMPSRSTAVVIVSAKIKHLLTCRLHGKLDWSGAWFWR